MPESMGGLVARVLRLEADVRDQDGKIDKLSEKIDKLVLAIVASSLSLSASLIVAALVYLSSSG